MSPENSKPEWFHMAEADDTPPRPRGKRVIRIMALAIPLLVLGAGLVFAQTQDTPNAVASAATSATSASTPASTPVTTPASASITIKKPSIAKLPTGGGNDEGLRSSDDD